MDNNGNINQTNNVYNSYHGSTVVNMNTEVIDEERRKYILSGVKDKQIIITSCSRDESEGFTDREIDVKSGKFEIRE